MVGRGGYDVVHSHGFDPPALRRARAGARSRHPHGPPAARARGCRRAARGPSGQRTRHRRRCVGRPGAGVEPAHRVRPRHPQRRAGRPHPVVRPAGRRADLRRPAQRREGCGRRHRDRAAGRGADRPLRGGLRRGLCPRPPAAPRGRSGRHLSRTADPDGAVAEARFGPGGPVSERLGRALRPRRGRGAGGRHAGRRLRARRIDRDHRRRGHRLPRRAGKRGRSGCGRAVRGEAGPATLPAARGRRSRPRSVPLRLRGPLRFGRGPSCARPAVSRATDRRTSGGPSEASRRPRSSDPRDPVGRAGRPDPAGHRGRGVESEGARPGDPAR